MRFRTVNDVRLPDLVAMARGAMANTISDLDFLETLAAHHCFIVPPYVLQASASGNLRRITRLVYDFDGEIDKPRVLVAMARQLRRAGWTDFGGRLRL